MTISFPFWLIPVVVTFVLWGALLLRPLPPRGGDYSFTQEFAAVVRFAIGIFATLLIWLAWFVYLAFWGAA